LIVTRAAAICISFLIPTGTLLRQEYSAKSPASVHTTNVVQKAAISWDDEEIVHQDSQQNTHSANSAESAER
jgi:hypothetical protein